jgi:hypothetical protein
VGEREDEDNEEDEEEEEEEEDEEDEDEEEDEEEGVEDEDADETDGLFSRRLSYSEKRCMGLPDSAPRFLTRTRIGPLIN